MPESGTLYFLPSDHLGSTSLTLDNGAHRLTGGQVGLMVRSGIAEFQELEQWDVGQVTKYYAVGGQRIALRRSGVLYFVHTDHLGSTSLVTDASGNQVAEQRYYPYGQVRWSNGELPTDRQFTGQRREIGLGLYDYGARRYDPALGRFIQADTIVPQPGNPQALNRYAYADNNPLKHNDPNGHQANIPSVNGSIGCTGLLGANTITVANPAAQPLTTATYFTQNDVVIRPSSARPDDGVFLTWGSLIFLDKSEIDSSSSSDLHKARRSSLLWRIANLVGARYRHLQPGAGP